MIAVKELKTDRLVLKQITQNDLHDYIDWKSQQAYHEFLPSNPKTQEEYKKSIDAIIKGYQNKEKPALVWGIFLNNKLIGSVSIENLDLKVNCCEIGWGLNPKYHKQGYAFESVKCLINHIFNTVDIDKISITIWDGNDSSKKLAEKLGFVLENIESKARIKNGKYIDLYYYVLSKKDWIDTNVNKNKSDYFYEKSKMYYENYKAGKLTKKVGSVIKKSDKYLTIIRPGKRPMFAGGSVDKGETTRQAIVREVLEETGAKVTKLKYLHREYYSVDWEFEGIKFPNKRVEYTYLCEVEEGDLSAQGLEGEFDKDYSLKWCTSKELEELGMWGLDLVKKIEKENIQV